MGAALRRADLSRRKEPRFRLHGDLFSLSVFFLHDGRGAKTTCVISKKIASTAVSRNLIKRRCKEAARSMLGESHEGLGLVFIAKKSVREASFARIREDVGSLFRKLTRKEYTP